MSQQIDIQTNQESCALHTHQSITWIKVSTIKREFMWKVRVKAKGKWKIDEDKKNCINNNNNNQMMAKNSRAIWKGDLRSHFPFFFFFGI